MIEAGVRFPAIREAFNFELSKVAGCLATHAHLDHALSIKHLLRAGIDCYLSGGTAAKLGISGHRVHTVKSKEVFQIGTFKILPFDTRHDCAEPLGFLLQSGAEKLLFATDTYYIKYRFTGVTHFMIECNYSLEILEKNIESGLVPAAIRNRIVKSHFELERVKEFFRANNHPGINQIHLIHLSGGNSAPEHFKAEIQKITGKPVFVHYLDHSAVGGPRCGASINAAAGGGPEHHPTSRPAKFAKGGCSGNNNLQVEV